MIYFVRYGDGGPIKIGCATDPRDRLRSLQSGTPMPLTLLAVIAGSSKEEREIHARFARLRLRGEWFRPGPALLLEIHRHRAGHAWPRDQVTDDFIRLCEIEPLLWRVWEIAAEVQDDPRQPYFCANETMLGYGPLERQLPITPKRYLQELVGWHACRPDPEIRTQQAYNLAFRTIYGALPDCRNCFCG